MSNLGYMFVGFALAWGIAFVYLWMLSRRSAGVQRQLDAVERRVEKAAPKS